MSWLFVVTQVHDFGFLQFDPGAVQFMEYEEIPLAPEAATVGLEIRVVGNDSGEKVRVLQLFILFLILKYGFLIKK